MCDLKHGVHLGNGGATSAIESKGSENSNELNGLQEKVS